MMTNFLGFYCPRILETKKWNKIISFPLSTNEQVPNLPTTPFSQGTQLAISPITSTRQPLIRSAFETRAAKSKNDWESLPPPPPFFFSTRGSFNNV